MVKRPARSESVSSSIHCSKYISKNRQAVPLNTALTGIVAPTSSVRLGPQAHEPEIRARQAVVATELFEVKVQSEVVETRRFKLVIDSTYSVALERHHVPTEDIDAIGGQLSAVVWRLVE